jgi:DNA-binding GntR family transcriptional regulator
MVHSRAAHRAVARATDEEINELIALNEAMRAVSKEPDYDRLTDLNWAFHKKINVMAGSAKLLAVIRSTSVDIPRGYLSAFPGLVTKVNREHDAIVKAFVDRNAEAAETLIRRHVVDAGANLATFLAKRGLSGDGEASRLRAIGSGSGSDS